MKLRFRTRLIYSFPKKLKSWVKNKTLSNLCFTRIKVLTQRIASFNHCIFYYYVYDFKNLLSNCITLNNLYRKLSISTTRHYFDYSIFLELSIVHSISHPVHLSVHHEYRAAQFSLHQELQ